MNTSSLIIYVSALKQQLAADELKKIADGQEENIGLLKELRHAQDKIAEYTADDVIEEHEHAAIMSLLRLNDLETDRYWWVNGATDGTVQGNHNWDDDERMYMQANEDYGVTEEEAQKARNKAESWAQRVDNEIENKDDDQSMMDLKIQLSVDEYSKAVDEQANYQQRFNQTANTVVDKFGG